jgi:hypothetical protein
MLNTACVLSCLTWLLLSWQQELHAREHEIFTELIQMGVSEQDADLNECQRRVEKLAENTSTQSSDVLH